MANILEKEGHLNLSLITYHNVPASSCRTVPSSVSKWWIPWFDGLFVSGGKRKNMTPVEIRIRKSPPHITFLIDILQKHGRILATTPVFLQKQGVFPAENIFQLKRKEKRNNEILNKLCSKKKVSTIVYSFTDKIVLWVFSQVWGPRSVGFSI